MSQPVKIVLPDPVFVQLRDLSAATGEPLATLAAQLLKERLNQPDGAGHGRAAPRPLSPISRRPPWLEPDHSRAGWRADTWAVVTALQQRYPQQLAGIQDGWWEHPAQLETLAALAAWRSQLDQHADDPRDELLFHAQLSDYGDSLRNHARGVAKAWQPGAPPEGWATG